MQIIEELQLLRALAESGEFQILTPPRSGRIIQVIRMIRRESKRKSLCWSQAIKSFQRRPKFHLIFGISRMYVQIPQPPTCRSRKFIARLYDFQGSVRQAGEVIHPDGVTPPGLFQMKTDLHLPDRGRFLRQFQVLKAMPPEVG